MRKQRRRRKENWRAEFSKYRNGIHALRVVQAREADFEQGDES
jgi:hypothetical protein